MSALYPAARRDKLVVENLKNEVLIYDLERDQASCLNETAAAVWQYADGNTSVSAIAEKLAQKFGMPVDVGVVWYALDQLGKKNLLRERVAIPTQYNRMTRRDFLVKAGIVGAAVAIPVVIAMTAPTPAMANTCVGGCTLDRDCPSGCRCVSLSCAV